MPRFAALQILYSRSYRQRLIETMLKELERKLRDTNATWNEEILWKAFATAAPDKVKGRSAVNRFADLVPCVRFALEQQPILEPFAESVGVRFERWLAQKAAAGVAFTDDQRAWLELIRDHFAIRRSASPSFEDGPRWLTCHQRPTAWCPSLQRRSWKWASTDRHVCASNALRWTACSSCSRFSRSTCPPSPTTVNSARSSNERAT